MEQKLDNLLMILLNNEIDACRISMESIKAAAKICKNDIQAAYNAIDGYDSASESEKQALFSIISEDAPSRIFSVINTCMNVRYEFHYLIPYFDE